jgi:Domain of unknown function (DUF4198)
MAVLVSASAAEAHEFWLDPVDFAPKVGTRVPIVHRNGVNFLGDSYPYVRAWSKRFVVFDAKGERPIKAIEGDDPAVELAVPNPGLAIVAFHRAPDVVTYTSVGHLLEVLDDEGLDTIAADYRAMTSPPASIRESYTRFAKTLLNVGGGGAGADRAVGQALEIVVETNPYAGGPDAPVVARVLRDGKPVENILVKAFNRADPQSPRRVRSNADGRVTISGLPAGEVLLSAVVMFAGDPAAREVKVRAEWNSLWASVTFKRP